MYLSEISRHDLDVQTNKMLELNQEMVRLNQQMVSCTWIIGGMTLVILVLTAFMPSSHPERDDRPARARSPHGYY